MALPTGRPGGSEAKGASLPPIGVPKTSEAVGELPDLTSSELPEISLPEQNEPQGLPIPSLPDLTVAIAEEVDAEDMNPEDWDVYIKDELPEVSLPPAAAEEGFSWDDFDRGKLTEDNVASELEEGQVAELPKAEDDEEEPVDEWVDEWETLDEPQGYEESGSNAEEESIDEWLMQEFSGEATDEQEDAISSVYEEAIDRAFDDSEFNASDSGAAFPDAPDNSNEEPQAFDSWSKLDEDESEGELEEELEQEDEPEDEELAEEAFSKVSKPNKKKGKKKPNFVKAAYGVPGAFVIGLLSRLPFIGRLFKPLRNAPRLATTLLLLFVFVGIPMTIYGNAGNSIAGKASLALPDEGAVELANMSFDPSTQLVSGELTNVGAVNAEVSVDFTVYTYKLSVNPADWFSFRELGSCSSATVIVEIDSMLTVEAQCSFDDTAGLTPKVAGAIIQ